VAQARLEPDRLVRPAEPPASHLPPRRRIDPVDRAHRDEHRAPHGRRRAARGAALLADTRVRRDALGRLGAPREPAHAAVHGARPGRQRDRGRQAVEPLRARLHARHGRGARPRGFDQRHGDAHREADGRPARAARGGLARDPDAARAHPAARGAAPRATRGGRVARRHLARTGAAPAPARARRSRPRGHRDRRARERAARELAARLRGAQRPRARRGRRGRARARARGPGRLAPARRGHPHALRRGRDARGPRPREPARQRQGARRRRDGSRRARDGGSHRLRGATSVRAAPRPAARPPAVLSASASRSSSASRLPTAATCSPRTARRAAPASASPSPSRPTLQADARAG